MLSCYAIVIMLTLRKAHRLALLPKFRCQTSHMWKSVLAYQHLKSRSCVQVVGAEAREFLQGLITNDIKHLDFDFEASFEEKCDATIKRNDKIGNQRSMYALFLNLQGRISFDTIIFSPKPENYIINCDAELAETLVRHLKLYKVRRKLDIDFMKDFETFVIFDKLKKTNGKDIRMTHIPQEALCSIDSRVSALGLRLIGPRKAVENFLKMNFERANSDDFTLLRYSEGVPEGSYEIPYGKCFPHEYNADYLHGISFHKGCYIGQELTARVQHTGVIRKRIMPIEVLKDGNLENPHIHTDVTNEKGKRVGKLKAICGKYGLCLIRLSEMCDSKNFYVTQQSCKVMRPKWWPIEAQKIIRNNK